VVLALVAEKPRHGYEIIKAIEERVGGAYSPSPGVVYPTLTLLEELGHVRVDADGTKKLHSITEEGTAYLEANRTTVNALMERIAEAGAARASAEAPPVIRAMENLRMALRMRLSRGALSDEKIRAIAAALDAAATAVEQV
jgi:DNA-binding PadR family transcriptional regulator